MSRAIRRYVNAKEEMEYQRGYSAEEMQAAKLRKAFVQKYIADFDTNFYKTQEERDWGYVVRREYRYDVTYTSIVDGWACAAVVSMARMFQTKRFSWAPYFVVWPIAYLYFQPINFLKHNKKYFDMCNLGDTYYLGRERNKVLAECNRILDREDF
ncbi:unnamed protein product [Paramecium sonneborni]|uniref:Transmembrane protein n=1 Tax=Paramecium sonneborni TaxID=65129 RepID=A0A8S1NK49_9CILI|nr:unnamed protein product [Paramecium sonneborni]